MADLPSDRLHQAAPAHGRAAQRSRDIVDPQVLAAMAEVPRHEFVPPWFRESAYEDCPLPLADGQTISQPYIVALMTQLARPQPHSRALEVGVGSGYQSAILSRLCRHVFGVEIVAGLAHSAQERLARLGYHNITVRLGDGTAGWPEEAPFDIILVAAAPPRIPPALIDQLAPGGRLVLPVGNFQQVLLRIEKLPDGQLEQQAITPVSFVPMTGAIQRSS
ncbi:MAG: protein-L-isoaspartate(D-aspartate) O-methyltransferase [Pirellulales bacterium]